MFVLPHQRMLRQFFPIVDGVGHTLARQFGELLEAEVALPFGSAPVVHEVRALTDLARADGELAHLGKLVGRSGRQPEILVLKRAMLPSWRWVVIRGPHRLHQREILIRLLFVRAFFRRCCPSAAHTRPRFGAACDFGAAAV